MRISDWSSDVCSSDLVALGYGYHLWNGAGEASGYARARDEVAAASWANTVNGKLARQLDQTSTSTIPLIAHCSGKGWSKTKQDGQRSEKRRVGKEGGSKGRSRGTPEHYKKNNKNTED